MKRWQFWLGVILSAVFLYWAFSKLEWRDFWSSIQHANYWWLIPGILIYFVGVWIRAWRWHYLLGPIKKIPTRAIFPITTIGYMGNNIYPARAGEVLRAIILKRKEGVSITASLATIIIERIFDGVIMLAFVFINLPELARLSGSGSGFIGNIQSLALWGTAIFFGALILFLLAAMFPRVSVLIGKWFIDHLLPSTIREKALGILHKFLDGLSALRSPFSILMVFLTSIIIWLLETGKYWFVMHAFPFTVNFFSLMLLNGLANLATTIPSAPGYVGTWEAVTKAVLVAFHVPEGIALGYAVVLHIALWLPITLLGAFYMTREGIHWNDALRKETRLP
jgi:uncharacterized protein (TIRG00374 family)